MIERFLVWRARRKRRAQVNRMQLSESDSAFGRGFSAFLNQTRFYPSYSDRFATTRRWRRILYRLTLVLISVLLFWLAAESIRALRIF